MPENFPVNISLSKQDFEDYIVVLTPKSGDVDVVINTKTVNLPFGCGIFCIPDDVYEISPSENLYEILLYGYLVLPMLSENIRDNRTFCVNLHSEIAETLRIISADDISDEENSAFAYKFLMKLKKDATTYGDSNHSYPDIVNAALGIIHEEGSHVYGLGEIAEIIGISPEHLSRVFKKHVGITIGKYMTAEKIKLAKNLLSQKNLSISMISEICGFSDTGYFSKLFKNECGLTPSRYRSNILKSEPNPGKDFSGTDIWL